MQPISAWAPARRRFPHIALTAIASACAMAASAQTTLPAPTAEQADASSATQSVVITGNRDTGAYTVKESGSATKLDLTLRETPQAVTVITRERLDDQKLTSLREVLDHAGGLYSNQYDTERVLFYSRGFLVDSLLYDGVPAVTNFNTDSVSDALDTAMFERIEIVRGATGLMTGAGSPAASINLVRKRAARSGFAASADLSAGSWNSKRAEFDVSGPLTQGGDIRARVVAAAEDGESYQDLYRKKKYVLYGIVDADLTPKTRVSLGFDYLDNQPRSNTWGSFPLYLADGTPANWPTSVTTATDWAFWNRKTQTLFAELNHRFDSGWVLQSTLATRRHEEDYALFYVYGFPDPVTGEGLEPYAYVGDGKIDQHSLDIHLSGPFQAFGRKHELVFGYNGSRSTNKGHAADPAEDLAPVGNFFEWDGHYAKPGFGPSYLTTDIDTAQDGLYAASRLSLADDLKLIGGARYARWKVDAFDLYGEPQNSRYDFNKILPYAGVVWDVSKQFSVFASASTIFKPQTARTANGQFLDPIDGDSLELGIKGEHFDRRLNSSLVLFDTRQRNVAAPAFDEDGQPIMLPDGSQASVAAAGMRTRGFELEASGRFGPDVAGSFSLTRYITQDKDGQAVRTFIPGTLVRMFATWQARSLLPGLKLGAGVDWQSKSSTTVANSPVSSTTLRQGSVTNLSAMAGYEFSRQVSLQFNASNLLDKKYYVLDQYDNTYYGAPANYALTLRVAY